MKTENFDQELKTLAAMVGSFQSDVLFNQEYEALLAKIKMDSDLSRRQKKAKRLRKLLMHQAQFLMNEWLKAKREYEYI